MKKFSPATTLFVIDGSSFLYRAYYAIKPMTTSSGMSVQAVFGFCRMFKKLMDTFSPEHCVVVWDSPGRTVRHELYADYKATREARPSDLLEQKQLIQEFAAAIGLAHIAQHGVEADDLMYSLARDFGRDDQTVVFVTSDKDMAQAVTEHIVLYDPFKESFLGRDEVVARYGVPPEKLIFYFSLLGDASDNIPGVRGIGPKTAVELVADFENLEDLYSHLDRVEKKRTRQLLEENRDNAFLSQQLFTLQYYVTDSTWDGTAFNSSRWSDALEFFKKVEFASFIKGLSSSASHGTPLEQKYSFITVTTKDQLTDLCSQIVRAGHCALDTECTSLQALQTTLIGISVCVEHGSSYYIPLRHETAQQQLTVVEVVSALQPLLSDASITKIMHHAKFDMHVLATEGLVVRGPLFDTMIAAHLLARDGDRVGLKWLSEKYLSETMISYEEIVKECGARTFAQVPIDRATAYAAADTHQTFALWKIFVDELRQQNQQELFDTLEMPLVPVLYAMEREGIFLDIFVLQQLSVVLERQLARVREDIVVLTGVGQDFNLNSPAQIGRLLFEELQLTPIKKTATKSGYSTNQEVLHELALKHPVPALIVRYRELFKLKSTYVDALPTYINPTTGRIHTTFSQTTAATGRLASTEPNLQNIPFTPLYDDVSIRSAFKAPPGYLFVAADYSQIELRVLAYLSQDPALLEAFKEGQDIHARTAAGLFDVALDEVTKEQRQLAKRINFSILYGLTPYGLSKDLGISMSDAKKYIDKYFAQYPGIVAWMDSVIQETTAHGYVTTLWGRRRYIPGIYEKNRVLYDLARRVAINTKAQGTAAELMKRGMLNVDALIKQQGWDVPIVLQIHDELVFAVPCGQVDTVAPYLARALQEIVAWNVPLVVNVQSGADWHAVSV